MGEILSHTEGLGMKDNCTFHENTFNTELEKMRVSLEERKNT